MKEYIEKDLVRRVIESPRSKEQMINILKGLPTADVKPVVRGEWYLQDYYYTDELTGEKHHTKRCECSVCHERPLYNEFGYIVYSDFCPNCGADMRGDSNERE